MKYKYFFLLVFLFTASVLPQDNMSIITWETGIPAARTASFTNEFSFIGFGIGWRKFLNDRSNSIGIYLGWHNFDERLQEPINITLDKISGTISGTQLRAINSFPILLGFHHYFGSGNETRTVLGFNTGVYYIGQRLDIGVYRFQSENWHFGISPEISFIIPVGDFGTNISLSGKYHYAFDSGTGIDGRQNNFYSYWNICIGFATTTLF